MRTFLTMLNGNRSIYHYWKYQTLKYHHMCPPLKARVGRGVLSPHLTGWWGFLTNSLRLHQPIRTKCGSKPWRDTGQWALSENIFLLDFCINWARLQLLRGVLTMVVLQQLFDWIVCGCLFAPEEECYWMLVILLQCLQHFIWLFCPLM